MLTAYLGLLGAFVLQVAAQGANPSNITGYPQSRFGNDGVIIALVQDKGNGNIGANLAPLTQQAFDRLPHGPDSTGFVNGTMVLSTPGKPESVASLPKEAVAYTSCDAADYAGNIQMSDVLSAAVTAKAVAIVLYSTVAPFCNLTDLPNFDNYTFLYTMTNPEDSSKFLAGLADEFVDNNALLWSKSALGNEQDQTPGGFSGAGSTAVAMIILYSITGVITALFLVIIVTGAIRAHRHPERYGPRNVLGRARQSRAKGIARAMLDTLPIVKFGEQHDDAVKDVENQPSASNQSHELSTRSTTAPITKETSADASLTAAGVETVTQSHGVSTASASADKDEATSSAEDEHHSHSPTADEDVQGCSICTDDFERGQDIRVLPCGHQFHPACVDPWLLDVSGTCPLCRVDLHPQAPDAGGEGGELPPPLDPQAAESSTGGLNRRRDTIRQFFARSRGDADISGANREERLEALRHWRLENRAAAGRAAQAALNSTHNTTTTGETSAAGAGAAADEPAAGRLARLSRLIRRR